MADWNAVLRVVYVNGHPCGPSMTRLMRRVFAQGPGAYKEHRALMRRLHTDYPRRWRHG